MIDLLKRSVKITIWLVLATTVCLVAMRQARFAGGFLIAAVWMIINYLLTVKLLNIAVLRQGNQKLSLVLLVKFPLLYLIGFLLLFYKFFPIASIFSGITLVLLVIGLTNLCQKRTQQAPNSLT